MANLTDVLNFRSNLTGANIKSLYEAEPNAFVDSDKSKIDSLYYIPTTTITTNYDAADKDEVRCDSSGGTFTITLPASGSVKIVDIVGVDADTGFGEANKHVTLVPQPGTTILGETSLDLDVGASRLVFTLYGSDWKLIDVSAPRFVVSDWNDLNNKPNFVDSSTVSTSYDGTNVSSEIIFPVSGASFTAPLTLPNNSRINNVEHFYQTTKPTTRGDASALVAGDRWWKTDDGTEWFWNGTYWLGQEQVAVIEPTVLNISNGNDRYRVQGGYTSKGGAYDVFLKSIHAHMIFSSAQSPGGTIDSNTNYWDIQYQTVFNANSARNITGATYSSQGITNNAADGPFINLTVNAIVTELTGVGRFAFNHDTTGSPSAIYSFTTTFIYCLVAP